MADPNTISCANAEAAIAAGAAFGCKSTREREEALLAYLASAATGGSTVVANAGTLLGATLASNVIYSSLTSVGTITSGAWNGAAIGDAYISSAATWNAKQAAIAFGTGVQAALGVNVGLAGAPVVNGGDLGTPTSGTLTNCTFPTLNQNTTGSAATLTTARNINGVAFDGSADVTVPAAAGTLTGSSLAAGVTGSSLTSVGTITSGTWNGAAIGDAYISSAATWNAKQAAITFGTGVQAALGVNVGSAGSPVVNGGVLGTPTSGTLTNCTFPTLNQNTTGSAATLTTARNINGVAFDGSADVTVPAAAGTLTGSSLAAGVTGSSLTSVGTITSGTWNGAAIGDAYISSAATWNAKQAAITFGTGVQAALGVNVGSAGSPVVNGGVLGTPTSGTLTNCTVATAAAASNGTTLASTAFVQSALASRSYSNVFNA